MYSNLILGGAQLGLNYGVTKSHNYFCKQNSKEILNSAKNLGLKLVDIAFDYGDIFEIINEINPGLGVISKLKLLGKHFPSLVLEEHHRIGTLKCILIHDADQFDGSNMMCSRIKEFIKVCSQRNIEWGISIYESETLKRFVNNDFKPKLVQYPFNLLYAKDEIGDLCKKLSIKAHIRSVFLQGLLTIEKREDLPPEFFDNDTLISWQNWLRRKKIAPLSACLRGDRVAFKAKVIGVESCKQLETLVKFMDGDVIDSSCLDTSDDMRLLDPRKWIM